MYRLALLFVALLAWTGCDTTDSGTDSPDAPDGNVDDGSVNLADTYTADVSGTRATFFRANETGECAAATITLRFDVGEFGLNCIVVTESGESTTFNPDGTFTYELNEGRLTLTPSFDYSLTGTALEGGARIEALIQRGNGPSIEATLLAQP